MDPSFPNSPRPPLEVRGARASSVIVQRIPAGAKEVFLQWQRDISAAAAQFPGYQTTEVYPPAGQQDEWVAVIHFDDAKTLQDWLDSPTRAEWVAKFPTEIRDFRLTTLTAGFGPWFAGLVDGGQLPPHWKMILTVLLALYPIVMLQTIWLSPHTIGWFGLSVAMLIGNAIGVVILEWGTPALSRVLAPWLLARGKEGRALSLGGAILIAVALGVMTFLFALIKG